MTLIILLFYEIIIKLNITNFFDALKTFSEKLLRYRYNKTLRTFLM